jgi:hypothetical protein
MGARTPLAAGWILESCRDAAALLLSEVAAMAAVPSATWVRNCRRWIKVELMCISKNFVVLVIEQALTDGDVAFRYYDTIV